jgi:hypothetical protein
MYKMIIQTVDTTKMYFYYAPCFGHIGTIFRQFQYMNTTVELPDDGPYETETCSIIKIQFCCVNCLYNHFIHL